MNERKEPWQSEGESAWEMMIGFTPVAWTEDDDVYLRNPANPSTQREDGFIWIGHLAWDDDVDEAEAENEVRLRNFVTDYKMEQTMRGVSFVPQDVMERESVKGLLRIVYGRG